MATSRRIPGKNPQNSQSPLEWLTLEQVLTLLQVKRSTFDDWRRKKVAPPITKLPNRQIRIERGAFEAWMKEREEA
ncbi:helix-turn-helix domain-containing protein [Actinocorallia libanotica]|uniref:Helix-turn-helix domain-containing protein n=1 Tax=Actinocorallia libanotica TaxID=46162 RepID=A0ABN1RZX2_9ACTN